MKKNNKLTTVLIADSSIEHCNKIKSIVEAQNDIVILDTAHNGAEACSKILSHKPNVAILDPFMAELDGLGMLETIYADTSSKALTKTIILSASKDETFIKRSSELGASYYMLKPLDPNSLLKRIRELANTETTHAEPAYSDLNNSLDDVSIYPYETKSIGLQRTVANLVLDIGIPASIIGSHYIRDAIVYCTQNFELIRFVTKELYPSIAKKYKTTSGSVERGIRHAVEVAWKNVNQSAIAEIFNHILKQNKGKPSNSEFIALIVQKIKLDLCMCR